MFKGYCLLLWALLFTAICANAQTEKSKAQLPDPKLPRNGNIDVKHIAIDLRFDLYEKKATGSATIRLTALQPLDKITLDAAFMSILDVTDTTGRKLNFQYAGGEAYDNLGIDLGSVLNPAQEISIIIKYQTNWKNETDPLNLWGSFGKGIRYFHPTGTEPRKRNQVWSSGAPDYNRYWYPCYDNPADLLTTSFTATVDKELMVISNGKLIHKKENKDDTNTWAWEMKQPHANHNTSFVIGYYAELVQDWGNIRLHNYAYPDEIDAVKASTVRLSDMMSFFSVRTGTPYPYASYSQVFVQDYPWGGGHNAGLSTISENMIDDAGTHADFFYLWDGVEANDLAAQWYGNWIVPKDWADSWLSKSFARYFDGLYSEYKNGFDEFQFWNRSFNLSSYLADWNARIRRPIVTNRYDQPATMFNDNYASLRGAEVLHMLRSQLGDETWWKLIRNYTQQYGGKQVETSDFKKVVESVAGKSMDWFFDQWLYKTGHPVFKIEKIYDPVKKQLDITVIQEQIQDTISGYPAAKYFSGKVGIELDDSIKEVWLEAKPLNTFSFYLPAAPRFINFDYESRWIKEVKEEKSTEEWLWLLDHSRDILARNQALTVLSSKFNGSLSKEDSNRIIQSFRGIVMGNAYWRLKATALSKIRSVVKPPYDNETVNMLLDIVEKDSSWMRTAAISFLGFSKDNKFIPLYKKYLSDKSDRVINAAAIALGKTKDKTVFPILNELRFKSSWKNQSLISALNGMKELGNKRAIPIALEALKDTPAMPRWTLATSTWDFRIAAAETLVALNAGSEGFDIVYKRYLQSIADNDISDIFNNVLLMATIGDKRGKPIFDQLKLKFKDHTAALTAIAQYEDQFNQQVK